ncbi:MAG: LPS export ABC transporter periplasmic protein LptC [Chthonomonas sp.]|nr:LPS export ABC transporter periplasmic protein LptC [Chthonomonas sp.]
MSRSTKPIVRNFLWGVASIALLWAGFLGVRSVIQADPFADFKPKPEDPSKAAVTMHDTKLRGYQDGKLVMMADSDKLEITRDRNIYRAEKIRNGMFKQDQKTVWSFVADKGVWQDQVKRLFLDRGIRAWNKDIDLKSDQLMYSNLTQDMVIPEGVKGKFYSGNIDAKKLNYNFKTEKWTIGKVVWVGTLAQNEEVPVQQPSPAKPWTLTSEGESFGEKGHLTLVKATAKNGEVEIRADKIEKFDPVDGRPEMLVASGNVRYFGQEANLMCDRVVVFRRERRAILEGKVNMLIKAEAERGLKVEPLQPMRPVVPDEITRKSGPAPKDSDELRSLENRRKYPVRVLADRIEYWYQKGQRRALATGSPQARQELPEGQWRMVWAPRAEWDGENERMKLLGKAKQRDVRATFSDGSTVKSETFTFSTARDVETWSATMVEAQGTVDEDEIPENPGGGSGTNPPRPLEGPIGWIATRPVRMA